MNIALIYTTHSSEDQARSLSDQLVEEKLIACANILPIQSCYWWNNTIEKGQEWVAILKTKPSLWEPLQARITELHPYEVPCILKWEVEANAAYGQWIVDSVIA